MKKPYIIAEPAYSFEGDFLYLKEVINQISETDIDCIKYHMMFNIESYVSNNYDFLKRLLTKWLLKEKEWFELLTLAKKNNKQNLILVDDLESIKFCEKYNELVDSIEVHAACVNDFQLLKEALLFAQRNNKRFYIGISGFEITELSEIIEFIKTYDINEIILMYGFQNFPTKIEEINLKKIKFLSEMYNLEIGYADHTSYDDENKKVLINTSYILGANIQEIHCVIKKGIQRTDYITALTPQEISAIKKGLIDISKSLGIIDFRLNEGEKKYLNFRKVPLYSKDLKKGEIIKEDNIVFKRVENPKRQNKFNEITKYYNCKLKRDVQSEEEFSLDDLEDRNVIK